jgi:hypothetical protein
MSRVRDIANILSTNTSMATDAEVSVVSAQIPSFVTGKNLAINGAFDFWQRGTSFSNPFGYTADRFAFANAGSLTYTISRQAFTAGDEPSGSIATQYYLQNATTAVVSPSITDWYHRIEDVSMLSGKTITISFYARATIGTATLQLVVSQYNGTSYVDTAVNEYPTFVAGNGWRRYSATVTLPTVSRSSISGSSHNTNVILRHHHSITTFGIWGFQVELGSVATPFSRAGGDLQGELAKCQRYYWRSGFPNESIDYIKHALGYSQNTTSLWCQMLYPVTMRVAPSIESSTLAVSGSTIGIYDSVSNFSVSSLSIDRSTTRSCNFNANTTGLTAYRPGQLQNFNNTNGYIGFSAEL